jgi:hypothetical protein
MSDENRPTRNSDEQGLYEICIKGHLDEHWKEWFEGMTISLEGDGNTRLTGPVVDQAALYGFLRKIRDFGMPLISVNLVDPNPVTDLISKERG